MLRTLQVASAGALVLLLGLLLRLSAQQTAGPVHFDLRIAEETPATLYLPHVPGAAQTRYPEPPPEGERPPAVVLMHGFASDRFNMSPLARSLASAGYAVLAIDAAGHGENRRAGGIRAARSHPKGGFYSELEAAVDYVRASELADGTRISAMGHSMGANAVLGYASWDPGLDGVVMIAGGWQIPGPHAPANALFLYAEGDRAELHDSVKRLASHIAGGGEAMADGEVRKVDKDAGKVTLKHGYIKSLDMPPMTMVFQVKDRAVLDTLKAGDKVRFAAEEKAGAYVVTAIEPAK